MFFLPVILFIAIKASIIDENYNRERYKAPNKFDPVILQATQAIYNKNMDHFNRLILETLINQTTDDNFFISPESIWAALSIAGLGAENETLNEYEKLFGNETYNSTDDVKNIFELIGYINAAKDQQKSAPLQVEQNSLWINSIYDINRQYVEDIKTITHSDVFEINMQSASVYKLINTWIKKKSDGLFQEVLSKFDRGTEMDLMHYVNLSDVAVITLPLEYKGVEIMFILPHDFSKYALEQAAFKYFSTSGLKQLWEKQTIQRITLDLPKFEIRFKISLKETLKKIGLNRSFSDDAEFPRIAKQHLKITDVIHEAYLKIEEQGTKDFASTSEFQHKGINFDPLVDELIFFKVDRPFNIAIFSTQTYQPILTGMIVNLGEEEKDDNNSENNNDNNNDNEL